MAQLNSLRIDTRAENFVINFFITMSDFRKVFPGLMPVKTLETWFPEWDVDRMAFKDDREVYKKKTGKEKPKEVDFEVSRKNLIIEAYHMFNHVPMRDIKEAAAMDIMRIEDTKLRLMTTKILNFLNRDMVAMFGSTALWPNSAAAVKWDAATGDPQKDYLNTIRPAVINNTMGQYAPNTALFGTKAMAALKTNATVRAMVQYTQLPADVALEGAIRALFGVDRVIELRSVYDTAEKGKTPVPASNWTTSAWFGYIEPNPTRETPTAAAALVAEGEAGNEDGIQVYKASALNGQLFEDMTDGIKQVLNCTVNIKQTCRQMGYLFTGVYTP